MAIVPIAAIIAKKALAGMVIYGPKIVTVATTAKVAAAAKLSTGITFSAKVLASKATTTSVSTAVLTAGSFLASKKMTEAMVTELSLFTTKQVVKRLPDVVARPTVRAIDFIDKFAGFPVI